MTLWPFLLLCASLWGTIAALPLLIAPAGLRRGIARLLPVLMLAGGFVGGAALTPAQRLMLSTLLLLYTLKSVVLLRMPRPEVAGFSRRGLLLYLTLWPGMDAVPFRSRVSEPLSEQTDGQLFIRGAQCVGLGAIIALALGVATPHLPPSVIGWLGIVSLLLIVHFGYAQMLTWTVRAVGGWKVGALFNDPLQSDSLADFWSRRWNRAFVEMNRLLFLRPLRRRLGATGAVLAVFAISGLLHEGGLSYPAWAGWGGPLLYFAIQGGLTLLEMRVLHVEKWIEPLTRKLWTLGCLFAPLPLLFHTPFREACIVPVFEHLHQLLALRPLLWYLDTALWLAGIGHFVVLIASFQVPARLEWKKDFAQLTPFNQKIFWTYGGFIVLCIVSFGTLTLVLHDEILRGDRAALWLAGFNGVFWLLRLGVDTFYFRHDDWPKGPMFTVGHVLLTSLFCALALTYVAVICYHAFLHMSVPMIMA